ncbi:MAG: heavy metal translocating P-type ATPase [Phycisphaerae bacterium]
MADAVATPNAAREPPVSRGGAAVRETTCTHCGLAVPAGLRVAGAPEQFCCDGCRAVYAVIHGCGLARYYRLREASQRERSAARTTGRAFGEYDDAVFQRLHVETLPDGLSSTELFLEGVHCGACVWLVEKLPVVCSTVVAARLDLRRAVVRVVWDPRRGRLSQIARALDSLGYPPHPARNADTRALRQQEDRRLLTRIAVAGALAGNVMMLAFALYGGFLASIETQFEVFFRWLSMLLGVIALAWPGSVFFRGAWAAVRTRASHLDLPIAIGLLAGGVAGVTNTVLGRGEIYFDSLTVLVFLLLIGRWIQRRQQRWASDAIESLYALTPSFARRIDAGGVAREVPIEAIAAGDRVVVRAGETVPTDGVVESGTSAVNQSLLTGESRAVDVGPGSRVCAGAINAQAEMVVCVEASGEQTRIARLMQLVERSARQPAPIVRLADRVAAYFTVAMLLLAAATLLGWLWLSPARAWDHATALLIVTCPCALGLATPLTLTVAIGRAARRRILVKGGETLQTLSRSGTILLDKTGTLTQGRTALLSWTGEAEAKSLLAAVELHSSHPIARAVVAAIGVVDRAEHVVQHAGGGIEGLVRGRRVLAGSPRFMHANGPAQPDWCAAATEAALARGHTAVLAAVDDKIVALASFGDPVREDAAEAVAALRKLGWRVGILSGDDPRVVRQVAARLSIDAGDAHGDVTPEQKLATVERARRHGPVIMVGDGVNDAAALASATIGIAVHGGAEASLAAADVYLDRPGLAPLVELVEAGRRTFAAIRRGMGVSIAYNAVAAGLAMGGVLSPLIAAVLMPLSSFTLVSLAFAARTFEDER